MKRCARQLHQHILSQPRCRRHGASWKPESGSLLAQSLTVGGNTMRHQLLSFVAVIAIVAAVPANVPALAAEIEAGSQIDAVTVYPDGATVTRFIRLDLP